MAAQWQNIRWLCLSCEKLNHVSTDQCVYCKSWATEIGIRYGHDKDKALAQIAELKDINATITKAWINGATK